MNYQFTMHACKLISVFLQQQHCSNWNASKLNLLNKICTPICLQYFVQYDIFSCIEETHMTLSTYNCVLLKKYLLMVEFTILRSCRYCHQGSTVLPKHYYDEGSTDLIIPLGVFKTFVAYRLIHSMLLWIQLHKISNMAF